MKRTIALLLALITVWMLVVGCAGSTGTKKEETKSSGTEENKQEETQEEQDPNVVTPSMREAWEEATEYADGLLDEIEIFKEIRLARFLLPCNKQFYDKMDASIKQMEEAMKDYPAVVYKPDVYKESYTMEATWQDIMKMKNASVGAGWVKNNGWYMQNVAELQGDIYYATTYENTEDFMFDILDGTLADMKSAGNAVDEDIVAAFKNVCIKYVVVETVEGYPYSAWMTKTTDVDSRVIEQIYYDMIGEGVDDNGVNNNPMSIEQGRKPYKDVSTEDMKASLVMLADRYNEFAEEFEALKPLAKRFADYVASWNGVQE